MESRNVDVDEKRPSVEELGAEKKKKKTMIIRYKGCMKNHAASIGGNATDGCGEFMASGEEGTPDSLKCSACKCHRNFHRKHFEASQEDSDHTPSSSSPYYHHQMMMLPKNNDGAAAGGDHDDQVVTKPLLTHNLCLTASYDNKSGSNNGSSDHEKRVMVVRKRFRTKFSEEQKEKMLRFADKVGWRMKKVDESMVQLFCEESGINRRVLKVWMHNNKNNFAKRNLISTS